MKVLNLQCSQQHSFEGWFASQLARGLVECPMCCDSTVQKMPSAPRLNLGAHQARGSGFESGLQKISESASSSELARQQSPLAKSTIGATDVPPSHSSAEQAELFTALRQMVANTEDVGDRFAHEARAMHCGDSQARSIRGTASAREAQELLQEGIDVLPLPPQFKETLQ